MIGDRRIANPIDLRPFRSISPNLAVQLPFGVVKVSGEHSYPEGFELPVTIVGR